MASVIYFMPYDPNKSSITMAHYEYKATGYTNPDTGDTVGMYKNLNSAHDQALLGNVAGGVWWDGSGHSTQLISTFPSDTKIMIRGHGMPGCDIIEGGRGGEKVDYKDAANRLFASGLNTNYSGSIICYCCHSAESATDLNGYRVTNGKPFAENLANYMYGTLGYRSAKYYGYLGSIDSYAKDGDKGKTTYSRGPHGQGVLGTSDMATVQFHPS